jgi:hypothetical protein
VTVPKVPPNRNTVKPAQAPSERALRFVRVVLLVASARDDVKNAEDHVNHRPQKDNEDYADACSDVGCGLAIFESLPDFASTVIGVAACSLKNPP